MNTSHNSVYLFLYLYCSNYSCMRGGLYSHYVFFTLFYSSHIVDFSYIHSYPPLSPLSMTSKRAKPLCLFIHDISLFLVYSMDVWYYFYISYSFFLSSLSESSLCIFISISNDYKCVGAQTCYLDMFLSPLLFLIKVNVLHFLFPGKKRVAKADVSLSFILLLFWCITELFFSSVIERTSH